jgi:23S rRNA (guanosine2251-2'-O)-methyltransferase
MHEITSLAREKNVPVQLIARQALDRMAVTMGHQGLLARVAPKEYVELDDLFQLATIRKEPPFLVLLDHVADPQNLGSILRVAEAVGVQGVIIPKRRGVPLTAAVAKASAGAVEHVPVARVGNLVMAIENLKKQGCWVVGADMSASQAYFEADLTGPLVLVVGGEGKGLSRLVREKCDFMIRLPMRGVLNSLNVAVASAIVLYEVLRQRLTQTATARSF